MPFLYREVRDTLEFSKRVISCYIAVGKNSFVLEKSCVRYILIENVLLEIK